MVQISTNIIDYPSYPEVKIITVSGDMDESSLIGLLDTIKEISKNPSIHYVIIDLTNITFMNSKGIGYLISIHSSMSHNNQKCILTGNNKNISDLITMIGIEKLIPYYATIEEALQNTSHHS